MAVITTGALDEDVSSGRAEYIGQQIRKTHLSEPTGVFFEDVVRTNPADPASPKIGQGRFHAEIWMLSWLGIDFRRFSKAQLVATRFSVDALLPFGVLFLVSAVTRPVRKDHLDQFFARLHTPVQPSPEQDQRALARAAAQPGLYDEQKIWRRSDWEILRPGWIDLVGFGGSWLVVGLVVLLLCLLVTIGR